MTDLLDDIAEVPLPETELALQARDTVSSN